jgi:hypothetical protein
VEQAKANDEYILNSRQLAWRNAEQLASSAVCKECYVRIVRDFGELFFEVSGSDAMVLFFVGHTVIPYTRMKSLAIVHRVLTDTSPP